ncbi:TELO2-interacting protein 1-like protein [Trichoplax sp. H2]|nr:TELO2-interacting protein 1-like protein [Trichoplax sp. H2]|eukprot:RDD37047.1 TELO2-interacting protein 1-like protein [Trichoplax sp. H2]
MAALQATFHKFRPVCIAVLNRPSVDNLRQLYRLVEGVDQDDIKILTEYVIFPIRVILMKFNFEGKQFCDEKVIEAALVCAKLAFTKVTIEKFDILKDFVTQLCLTINPRICEEIKVDVVECIHCVAVATNSKIWNQLYLEDAIPILGHLISSLLLMIEKEKLIKLRLTAIDCLLQISLYNVNEEIKMQYSKDIYQRKSMSHALSIFIPGISTALGKVIVNTANHYQNVAAVSNLGSTFLFGSAAIQALSLIISLAMDDTFLPNDNQKLSLDSFYKLVKNKTQDPTYLQADNRILRHPKRDMEWFKTTSSKLKTLLSQITQLISCPNFKIRQALAKLSARLLFTCIRSLKESLVILMEVLVALTYDEYDEIRNYCQDRLALLPNHFSKQSDVYVGFARRKYNEQHYSSTKNYSNTRQFIFLTCYFASIFTFLTFLTDDKKQLITINLLCGYLILLGKGERLNSFLNSQSHLSRLSMALIQILELQKPTVGVTDIGSTLLDAINTSYESSDDYPRKNFKHILSEAVETSVRNLCRIIGQNGCFDVLVDHCISLLKDSISHRKQVLLILNEILLGAALGVQGTNARKYAFHNSIRNLLMEYLSPTCWMVRQQQFLGEAELYESIEDKLQIVNRQTYVVNEERYSGAVMQCLLMEGLANLAKFFEGDTVYYLRHCLYLLLEKLDTEIMIINRTAYITLTRICNSFGYSSIPEVIGDNIDYLVNAIALNLRNVNENGRSLKVLKVVLEYGTKDTLPILEDSILEMYNILDNSTELYPSVISVLFSITCAIRRWFISSETEKETEKYMSDDRVQSSKETPNLVENFLTEYWKFKNLTESNNEENENDVFESASNDENAEDDVEKPKLLYVQILLQVMDKCANFLASNEYRMRIKLLEVIKNGILSLSKFENDLLPAIHKIWNPFIRRFTDGNVTVQIKAMEVLSVMAQLCGEFLQRRISKEIIPTACKYLTTQANIRFKREYKLQMAILKNFSIIFSNIQVLNSDYAEVSFAAVCYLSIKQPVPLQEVANNLLVTLSQQEQDLVWFILHDIYTSEPLEHPDCQFRRLHMSPPPSEIKAEFYTNVMKLLQTIE